MRSSSVPFSKLAFFREHPKVIALPICSIGMLRAKRSRANFSSGRPKSHFTHALAPSLLLHLLPPGFVRIRNFGFLANRNRATLLPLCFRLLNRPEESATPHVSPSAEATHSLCNCPVCGGTMRIVERLSAAQLLLRSPPEAGRCAA